MAEKATVQLTVDTKDFLKNLTKAIDTIGVASEEVRDLSKDFTSAFAVSDGKVKQLKNSIAAMIAAGNNSGDAFDGLVAELKAAQAQSDNLKNALKEVDKLVVSPEIDDKGIKSFKEELTGAFESLKGGDAGGARHIGQQLAGELGSAPRGPRRRRPDHDLPGRGRAAARLRRRQALGDLQAQGRERHPGLRLHRRLRWLPRRLACQREGPRDRVDRLRVDGREPVREHEARLGRPREQVAS